MSEIQNVTVLGAGVLGSQIVMQAAYAGKNVVAYDIKQEFLDKLPARWEWMRGHYAKDLSAFTAEKFDDAVGRITTSTDIAEAVGDADVVIEAVPENLDLKKEVWGNVGKAVKDSAILLTNSSSLRPSDFADATGRADRFLALH
ncbi:MAG: 3-hydroxyacyl-CoA dehydrogenase NAD-binding domain-containing protein, partial [Corynebacterium variabile]